MRYLKKFDEIFEESLPRETTVRQLKKLRQITRSTDIGEKVGKLQNQGANVHYDHNPIDTVESYEDYQRKAEPQKITTSKSK